MNKILIECLIILMLIIISMLKHIQIQSIHQLHFSITLNNKTIFKQFILDSSKKMIKVYPLKIDLSLGTFKSRQIYRTSWGCSEQTMVKFSSP